MHIGLAKCRRVLGSVVLGLVLSTNSQAMDNSPMPMLRTATDQMLTILRTMQTGGKKLHTAEVEKVVRRVLIPKVDQDRMAKAVVGRAHWVKAMPASQQAFTHEFIAMIVHFYSEALAGYNNQAVKFLPVRARAGATRVVVKSLVEHASGPTIEVSYQTVQSAEGWRVADFSVDGISMIQSYRSQFAGVLSEKGLEGLLEQVKQHNRRIK